VTRPPTNTTRPAPRPAPVRTAPPRNGNHR
jgi:hypothetical protein